MLERIRILARIAALTWAADPLRAAIALILTAFDYASPVLAVLGVRHLVDAAGSGDGDQAMIGVALLVVTVAAGQAAGFGAFAVGVGLRERVGHRLELDIASAVAARPDLEHLERPEYLDRLTLLREQAPNLARLQDSVLQAIGVAVRLATSVALLASVDPALLLLVVFGLPSLAANVAVDRITDRRDQRRAPHQRRATILDWYIRSAGPAKEVRIFGVGGELRRRISRDRLAADDIIRSSNLRITAIQSGGWAIFGAGFVLALILLARRAAGGDLGVGELAMVVALGAQLNGQLGAMSTWLSDLLEMLRTADHYRWLISTTKNRASGVAPRPQGGDLRLANVTFGYPGTTTNVLDDISLTIPAGSTIAIVGENGAGKTTLIKLLIGLYQPTSGVITVDDVDIATLDPVSWRQGLSGAFQDTPPLEFRLRDVVGIGDVQRLDDDLAIHAAVDAGNATDLVESLALGYETELGKSFDNGTQLSGGQWQRLALARAMMRPGAHLLMLDEPTANLDPRAEHEVFERYATTTRRDLGTIHPNITVLISHRFSTVQMATFIVVLDNGRIAECGSHRELINHNGVYAELFLLQASGYQ